MLTPLLWRAAVVNSCSTRLFEGVGEDGGLVRTMPGVNDLDDAIREPSADERNGYEPQRSRVGARSPGNPFLR